MGSSRSRRRGLILGAEVAWGVGMGRGWGRAGLGLDGGRTVAEQWSTTGRLGAEPPGGKGTFPQGDSTWGVCRALSLPSEVGRTAIAGGGNCGAR